jgi:hypothetical protein
LGDLRVTDEIIQLRPGERNELEVSTVLIRHFLGIADDEFIELTKFVNGKMWVGQTNTIEDHIRLLKSAHERVGYAGSYMLVNGPVDTALSARYEQDRWQPANNGRATDKDISTRRAVFIDVDPIRPKGISSTAEEFEAARDVARNLHGWLGQKLGATCLGFGCSGNGFYILIAVEPEPNPMESTERVQRFLALLAKKFSTDCVKIDTSVANPARLMSCPGTMKCKGRHTEERPHRMTSFAYRCSPRDGRPERISLGDL